MRWQGKRVLVTGAGGFIGSHLVEVLVTMGAHVRALVRYNSRNSMGLLEELDKEVLSNIEVSYGDIIDPYGTERLVKGMDMVFHLAAFVGIPFSYTAPQLYVDNNVKGTLNVLEACRIHNVSRMIHTSTSETYGTAMYVPIDENHPLQGQSPYSASKIAADKFVESFNRSYNLPVSTIRPFNTYGPRQSARAVIPTIITQVLAGARKVKLGSLRPVRDLTYVRDTVEGFLKVVENDSMVGEVINIGCGKGISIEKIVNIIKEIMNTDFSVKEDAERVRPESSEVYELVCDYTKAKEKLGWEPTYSLKSGLKETVDYLKKHIDKYKPHRYNV